MDSYLENGTLNLTGRKIPGYTTNLFWLEKNSKHTGPFDLPWHGLY